MLHLWGSECEPFMQMLHPSSGLGTTISPLIPIASGCLGSSILPTATTQFFDSDPKILLWLTLGATIAVAIFLSLIIVSFNYYGKLIKGKS